MTLRVIMSLKLDQIMDDCYGYQSCDISEKQNMTFDKRVGSGPTPQDQILALLLID